MPKLTSDIQYRPPFLNAGPPTSSFDRDHGYVVGDTLIDTTGQESYTCVKDSPAGAAVWKTSSESRRVIYPNDDLVALLNAATDGNEFILAEGTHNVTAQVTLANLSNVTVRGSKGAVLNITYSADAPFHLESPLSNISFQDLTIEFDPGATTHELFGLKYGSGDISALLFENIKYCANGSGSRNHFIFCNNQAFDCDGLWILNCYMVGTSLGHILNYNPVAVGKYLRDVWVVNNNWHRDTGSSKWNVLFFNNAGAGTDNFDSLVISGNRISHTEEFFTTNGDQSGCRGLVIESNIITGSGNNDEGCIFTLGWPKAVISDNVIEDYDGRAAIEVSGNYSTATGNIITGCTGDGMRVSGAQCAISGNTISGSGGDGIQVSGSGGNDIGLNTLHNNTGYGINETAGAGNNYAGNSCVNNTAGNESLSGTSRTRLDRSGTTIAPEGLLVEDLDTVGAIYTVPISNGAGALAMGLPAVLANTVGNGTWSSTAGAFTGITSLNGVTATELSQLETIGATTISAAQWGYLGAMNQGVATGDSVQFASITDGTATLTGGDLSGVGTLTATTITDGTWSSTAGAFTGVASIATPTSITMAEDGWIGIGAASERIVFNGTGDVIQISNAGFVTTGDVTLLSADATAGLTYDADADANDGEAYWRSNVVMGNGKRTYYEAAGATAGTESIYSPSDGNLSILAGTAIALDSDVIISDTNGLTLSDTTAAGDGVIYKGSDPFAHNFHHPTGATAIPGGQNTFVGVNAGNFTTGSTATQTYHGSYNSAFGVTALFTNAKGSYNSAFGQAALYTNSDGFYNAAFGQAALYTNSDGFYNAAFGQAALFYNSSGRSNSAFGMNAGRYYGSGTDANQTSYESVYLGAESRASANGIQDEIVIGYNAIGQGAHTAVLGHTTIVDSYIRGNLHVGQGAAGVDYTLTFDGETTDIVLTAMEDEGRLDISHPIRMSNVKTGATQVAAGAAAGEVWATSSHATLPDNVLMIGV